MINYAIATDRIVTGCPQSNYFKAKEISLLDFELFIGGKNILCFLLLSPDLCLHPDRSGSGCFLCLSKICVNLSRRSFMRRRISVTCPAPYMVLDLRIHLFHSKSNLPRPAATSEAWRASVSTAGIQHLFGRPIIKNFNPHHRTRN